MIKVINFLTLTVFLSFPLFIRHSSDARGVKGTERTRRKREKNE